MAILEKIRKPLFLVSCFFFVLISAEVGARIFGIQPFIFHTKSLWAMHRERANTIGKDVIVLTGGSRSKFGIDPAMLTSLGKEPVLLSIPGRPGLRVIKHLTRDTNFTGTVIMDMKAKHLLDTIPGKHYIEYYDNVYRNLPFHALAILKIRFWLQSRFRLHPENLSQHFFPDSSLARVRFISDFSARIRFSIMPSSKIEDLRKMWLKTASCPEEDFQKKLSKIRNAAQGELQKIASDLRKKGGDLILLRMPTSGEHWEIDEQCTPKKVFWDSLSIWTDIKTIHFMDEPDLQGFNLPNESHLDGSEVERFTKAFIRVLKRREIFSM